MTGLTAKLRSWLRRPAIPTDKRRWSARVVIKHALIQVPGTILLVLVLLLAKEPLGIPVWVLWSILGFWVTKDVLLFPFLWRSYDPDFPAEAHSLVGAIGVTTERLAPSGYVQVRGELWLAQAVGGRISKGQRVRVRQMRELTLIVEPVALAGNGDPRAVPPSPRPRR